MHVERYSPWAEGSRDAAGDDCFTAGWIQVPFAHIEHTRTRKTATGGDLTECLAVVDVGVLHRRVLQGDGPSAPTPRCKLASRLEEAAAIIKQVYRYVFHLITNVLWKIFLFNLIF